MSTTELDARPKRLSLSQIVEMLLTRHGRESSGVTLSRNASGETQIEVRVRAGDDDAATVEEAAAKAEALYAQLAERYPPGSGRDDATVSLTRNAKGETQIDVKVASNARGDLATLAAVERAAGDVYERLRGRYPLASGYAGAPAAETKGAK